MQLLCQKKDELLAGLDRGEAIPAHFVYGSGNYS
jgi:hypothetical protein